MVIFGIICISILLCFVLTYKQEYIGDITRGCASLSLEVYNNKTEIEKMKVIMNKHAASCGYENCGICSYLVRM